MTDAELMTEIAKKLGVLSDEIRELRETMTKPRLMIHQDSSADYRLDATADVGPVWVAPKEKGPTPEGAEPQVCQLCKKPYVKCFCLPL